MHGSVYAWANRYGKFTFFNISIFLLVSYCCLKGFIQNFSFVSHVTAWHNKQALPGWLHYFADAHRFRIGYLYASITPHHLPNPIIHGFKKCRVWCKDQSLTFRGHQSVWHPQRASLYIHCSHQANGAGHVTVLHSIMKRLSGGVGGCLKALRHRWLFPIFGSECRSVLGRGITVVPALLCYTDTVAHAQTRIHTHTHAHVCAPEHGQGMYLLGDKC